MNAWTACHEDAKTHEEHVFDKLTMSAHPS
jgi:hypothetical protein